MPNPRTQSPSSSQSQSHRVRGKHITTAVITIIIYATIALTSVAVVQSSATSAASPDSHTQPICLPLSSELDFAKAPPRARSDLAFCKEYKHSTCCDKSSTLGVLRSLAPYFQSDSEIASSFSESCRQLSSTIACAPCHPDIGTQRKQGVCPQLCQDWYNACRSGLFADVDGILRPCTDGSLVCARLDTIVTNGKQFCQRTGVGAGVMRHEKLLRESIAELSTSATLTDAIDDPEDEIACFDGTVPTRTSASSAATTEPVHSEDAGTARKRYYKTADEIAEIEKQRAKRAQREAAKSFDEQPLIKLVTLIERSVRSIVHDMQRAWSRVVRRLPSAIVPKSVKTNLESPVFFAIIMCLLHSAMWLFASRLLGRLCSLCRRPNGGPHIPGVFTAVDSDSSRSRSTLPSTGLTVDQLRAFRVQKFAESQYVKSDSTPSQSRPLTSTGSGKSAGTYTTVIDGEVVTLSE